MRRILAAAILLAVGLVEASTARAEPMIDSDSSAHLQQTASELVEQVVLLIHTLEDHGEAKDQANTSTDGEGRTSRTLQRGVLPYALTAYKLFKGDFPVSSAGKEASARVRDLFLQVKPKGRGGLVRCKLQF